LGTCVRMREMGSKRELAGNDRGGAGKKWGRGEVVKETGRV